MDREVCSDTSMPAEMVAAFGAQAAKEQGVWERLTPSQRARAAIRFRALLSWNGGNNDIDVDTAAQSADVSTSRFYSIASEWRDTKSLAALGVFARGHPRKAKFSVEMHLALSKAAREAILRYGELSTSDLVRRTLRMGGLPSGVKLPRMTMLREIVEAEVRRIATSMPLGQLVLFDCVATSLPREDRRPHIAFLCIDGGTGAVLGVAVGTVEATDSGYARAANDALRTIAANASKWRWSNVFKTMRVTAGERIDGIGNALHRLNATQLQSNFILERGDKRYGRFVMKTIGPRLGRVSFTPTRTVSGEALPANGDMTPWSEAEAYLEIRRASDTHNDHAISDPNGEPAMPAGLYEALATIGGI